MADNFAVKDAGGTSRTIRATDNATVFTPHHIVEDGGATISVDDGAGSLTVDGSVTANAGTNLNTSALALEAGGNLAAAAASLATIDNLVLAEDAAHQSADPGIQMLAVRDDTLNIRSGAENDYEPLHTNADGALWTKDVNSDAQAASLSVVDDWDESDRAKVNIIAGQAGVTAGAGAVAANTPRVTHASDDPTVVSLQLIDDAVFAEDVAAQAADKGIAVLAVRRDADTSLVGTDNDYANLQVDANGYLKVEIFDGGGVHSVDDGGASLTIDNTDLTAAAASLSVMDDWDNGASDGASVSGDVAHDSADAGEPLKVGFKAVDLGANPTDVAANDRTNWYAMRNGVPFVIGGAPFVLSKNLQITDADGAQTDTALITAAANVSIIVTCIEVCCDNANTVNVSVRIGFGTVNTPAADADKVLLFHPGIAPGSGLVKGSGSGIIGAGLSNEDLRLTCADPVTGSVSITVTYFTLAIG